MFGMNFAMNLLVRFRLKRFKMVKNLKITKEIKKYRILKVLFLLVNCISAKYRKELFSKARKQILSKGLCKRRKFERFACDKEICN